MTWKCIKNHQNPPKIGPESIKIHPKTSLGARPRTNKKKYEKSKAPGFYGIIDLEPKVVQNTIKKSSKNRCRKSIPKWCQKDRKRVEKWSQNGSKNHENRSKKRCRKRIGKNHEKTWKMKVLNLENHCFPKENHTFHKNHVFWIGSKKSSKQSSQIDKHL